MAEQIPLNDGESTLDGAITNVATLLTIQSADTGKFPAAGDFRALLISADGATREYVKVTGVAGAVWTIVREAEDASRFPKQAWGSGTRVVALLTKAGIQALLDDLLASAHVPATGDVRLSLRSSITGWVPMNDGSIGNAASGATTRANADTAALFALIWGNVSNSWAPIQTSAGVADSRGANAAADYAANKRLVLPRSLGRALAVAGAGSGLTARALGEYLGAEGHVLTTAEMPAHTHPPLAGSSFLTIGGTAVINAAGSFATSTPATTGSTGGGGSHNNMPPTAFLNAFIKL